MVLPNALLAYFSLVLHFNRVKQINLEFMSTFVKLSLVGIVS